MGNISRDSDKEGHDMKDETALSECLNVLHMNARWVALGTFGAAMIGGVGGYLLPPQYEARGLIQVGQIAQIGPSGQFAGSEKVESNEIVREHLQSDVFLEAVEEKLRLRESGVAKQGDFGKVTVNLLKDADLVELIVRASTAPKAEKFASAIVDGLREHQAKNSEPVMELLKKTVVTHQREIEEVGKMLITDAKARRSAVQNIVKQSDKAGITIVNDSNNEFMELLKRKWQLEQELVNIGYLLTLPKIRPTRLLAGSVEVSKEPVSPKRGKLVAYSGMFGLMLSVLWIFMLRMKFAR